MFKYLISLSKNKNTIDLIKSVDFLLYTFNKSQSRIFNFDEILFTPRLYKVGVFLTPGRSHALTGKSDSTLKVLTLNQTTTYFEILIENVNLADARSIDSAVWEYLRRLITVCP